jgi:cytochrome c oxidase cbb3-type subunit 3
MMEQQMGRSARFAWRLSVCRAVSVLAVPILALPILTGCNREGNAAQWENTAEASIGPSSTVASPAAGAVPATVSVMPPTPAVPAPPVRGAQSAAPVHSPQNGASALVAHPGNIQAGLPAEHPLRVLANPRDHDPRAAEEGKQLFVSYNCADCHGGEGSGGMGPSLQDGRWHFGGSAGEVYESISEGRPDGMPSWGGRISDSQIWALVLYVRTLSSGKDVTTQTFGGGGTVSRGGH